MFTPELYRAKAAEFTELAKTANSLDDAREFQRREHSLTVLADNEQWLADHYEQTVHAMEAAGVREATPVLIAETSLTAEEEEHILRCLGAALIMQWNTLPTKLRREIFDNAGSMGALLDTVTLRGQIARFLHRQKDGEAKIGNRFAVASDGMAPTMLETLPTDKTRFDASQHSAETARWDDEGGAPKSAPELTPRDHAYPSGAAVQ